MADFDKTALQSILRLAVVKNNTLKKKCNLLGALIFSIEHFLSAARILTKLSYQENAHYYSNNDYNP